MIPKRIFISRPIEESGKTLQAFASHGGQLSSISMVRFEPVAFELPEGFDLVFFSSIRAADFFLKQHPAPSVQFACAGLETAEKLKIKHQITCDFISPLAGNPQESANVFRDWLGDRRVFFPKSEQSLNSFSSVIPDHQKIERVVYKTSSNPQQINPCDLYIFSSPSNVKAFLEMNVIPSDAKCVAWGASTASYLNDHDISVFHLLKTGTLSELDDFLIGMLAPNDRHEI